MGPQLGEAPLNWLGFSLPLKTVCKLTAPASAQSSAFSRLL